MSTPDDRCATANLPSHAAGDTCATYGSAARIERAYKVHDRFLQTLAVGLARSLGLEVYRKGNKTSQTLYVASTDGVALDQFAARIATLGAQLEDALLDLTLAFIDEHTGVAVDVTRGPR